MLKTLVGYVKNKFDWKKSIPGVSTMERRFFKLENEYYVCLYQDSFFEAKMAAENEFISHRGKFPKESSMVPGSWVIPGEIVNGRTSSATLSEAFAEMVRRDATLLTKQAARVKWPE